MLWQKFFKTEISKSPTGKKLNTTILVQYLEMKFYLFCSSFLLSQLFEVLMLMAYQDEQKSSFM